MAENFNENDEDYVNSSAVEAVKMEDGIGLLLPIIILEMPNVLLMAATRNVQIARPIEYQVVKDKINRMGYLVKLVRVTKRVQEAYCAQLYLTKGTYKSEQVLGMQRSSFPNHYFGDAKCVAHGSSAQCPNC
ncbi:hypothetical protein CRYUN_Cryun26dG0128200 [Craigia yunnanensis]